MWQSTNGLLISVAAAGAIASFSETIASNAAILAGGLSWGGSKVANTFNAYKENSKEISKKDLYFYYKADKKMSEKL